jgi:hypothetical protein
MKKFLAFLILLSFQIFSAQKKVTIVDAETQKPITDARIIYGQEIVYSNDDGQIIIPNETNTINISAPQYGINNYSVKEKIELNPLYQDIEDVVIKAIDVKKLFISVLADYDKNYETKPSLYTGT